MNLTLSFLHILNPFCYVKTFTHIAHKHHLAIRQWKRRSCPMSLQKRSPYYNIWRGPVKNKFRFLSTFALDWENFRNQAARPGHRKGYNVRTMDTPDRKYSFLQMPLSTQTTLVRNCNRIPLLYESFFKSDFKKLTFLSSYIVVLIQRYDESRANSYPYENLLGIAFWISVAIIDHVTEVAVTQSEYGPIFTLDDECCISFNNKCSFRVK